MEIAMEVPQFQSFWAWKVRRCCKDAPIELPRPLSRQNAESFCKDLEQSLEAPIRINRWEFTQNPGGTWVDGYLSIKHKDFSMVGFLSQKEHG